MLRVLDRLELVHHMSTATANQQVRRSLIMQCCTDKDGIKIEPVMLKLAGDLVSEVISITAFSVTGLPEG